MEQVNKLFIDIQKGDLNAVKSFLEANNIDICDNYNRTALMNACLYGKDEIVEWLLGKGADVNLQDKNGYTALHFSAQEMFASCTQKLLASGANPNIQDVHGNTPPWVAIMNWGGGKNFDNLKSLIDNNADLAIKNNAGRAGIDLIPEKIKFDLGL